MITIKREMELIFIVVFATIAYFFVFGTSRMPQSIKLQADLPVSAFSSISPTPASQPEFQPKITTASWNSPDGTATIRMEEKSNQDSTNTYTFGVSSSQGSATPVSIFSKTVTPDTSYAIPYNTFSPDDKYLFLNENASASAHFLVFKASGDTFSNGEQYMDITDLFATFTQKYTLYRVTGWASDTLLILQTDGDKGPSFWFDVTSKEFTQLSTHF